MAPCFNFDSDFVPYSVRNGGGAPARFRSEDLSLHEGIYSLRDNHSILDLTLAPHEQGYGGCCTWLSGELSNPDAFAISFIGEVPEDFQFGIGYVNNRDLCYSNHYHALADLNARRECLELRKGPPDPGQFATVEPTAVASFETAPICLGQSIGLAVRDEQVDFFQVEGDDLISVASVRINNDQRRPLRVYFSCYIEKITIFSIKAEDPLIRTLGS